MEEICFRLFISTIDNNNDDGWENLQITKQQHEEIPEENSLRPVILNHPDTSPHANPCEKVSQSRTNAQYKRENEWITFEGSMGVEGRGKPEFKTLRKVASFREAGLLI